MVSLEDGSKPIDSHTTKHVENIQIYCIIVFYVGYVEKINVPT